MLKSVLDFNSIKSTSTARGVRAKERQKLCKFRSERSAHRNHYSYNGGDCYSGQTRIFRVLKAKESRIKAPFVRRLKIC